MKNLLKEYLFAFVLFVVTKLVLVFAFIFQIPTGMYRVYRDLARGDDIKVDEYMYNQLRITDIMVCSMLYGTERATISGWTYYLGKIKGNKFHTQIHKGIDVLFFDENHCSSSYEREAFELKLKEYTKENDVKDS